MATTRRAPRKQGGGELDGSKLRFEDAFLSSPIGIAVIDLDGRLVEVNDALCAFFGHDRSELQGIHFQDVTHQHDVESDLLFARELLDGKIDSYVVEKRYLHASGPVIWGLLTVSLVRDDEGNPLHFFAQLQDITSRKASEKQLHETAARLSALIEHLQSGVMLESLQRELLVVNRAFCEMFGLEESPRELIGTDCRNALQEWKSRFAEGEHTIDRIEELIADRIQILNEEVMMSDGRIFERDYIPVFARDSYVGHFWIYRDVTQRVRNDHALRESEAWFRELFESTSDLIQSVAADGRYIYVNPAWRTAIGYRADEVPLLTIDDVVHPSDRAKMRDVLASVLQGDPSCRIDVRFQTRSGNTIIVEGSATRFVRKGAVIGTRAILRDVTERRMREQRLAVRKEELESIAWSDALTGVANRRAFDEFLVTEAEAAIAAGRPLSLILADVDHFKRYNDDFGHQAGDAALIAVAQALAESVRGRDLVARFGGEEFAVVLPGTPEHEAAAIAERMRRAVEKSRVEHRTLTASFGVAGIVPSQPSAHEELVRAADEALYSAKRAGRNRVHRALSEVLVGAAGSRLQVKRANGGRRGSAAAAARRARRKP